MKIIRLEHVGIAVEDLGAAKALFHKLLDTAVYKEEAVERERVITAFLDVGNTKLELLKSTTDDGPIAKFIEKRKAGIHHMAFEVADIHEAFEEAKALNLVLLNDQPKAGADNKLIFFVHPKSAGGVLLEFCQTKKDIDFEEE